MTSHDFLMPSSSVPEQIQAAEGGQSNFASILNFSSTVRFRVAIDLQFSSTDRSPFSESAYRYCCQQVVEGQTSSKTSERLLPEAEAEMRCNACWQELEGRAVSTACGHLFCTEDASKILNNDAVCPICDQVLSKSLIKPVDINPNEEWTNMAMAGVSPHILMKSVYQSVMFYVGQMELQNQVKMNRLAAQCRQKCKAMQEKCTEKLEQVRTAYQKMTMKYQQEIERLSKENQEQVRTAYQKMTMKYQQEIERLSKENQELQENLNEKCRQKRKLDEMYDNLKSEYESVKRSATRPASKSNFYSSTEPDFFVDTTNMNGSGDPMRKDVSISRPQTPGTRENLWPTPARETSSNNSGQFSFPGGSPMKQTTIPSRSRLGGGDSAFGGGAPSNPSMSLRNLVLSPIKRPQLTRTRTQMF